MWLGLHRLYWDPARTTPDQELTLQGVKEYFTSEANTGHLTTYVLGNVSHNLNCQASYSLKAMPGTFVESDFQTKVISSFVAIRKPLRDPAC